MSAASTLAPGWAAVAAAGGRGSTGAVPAGRIAVLTIAGDLDRSGLDLLGARCHAELAAGATIVVIDMTGMTACPPALFGLLARTGLAPRSTLGASTPPATARDPRNGWQKSTRLGRNRRPRGSTARHDRREP